MNPVKRIAILTSGGDAQGMNAALRSLVRTALNKKIEVFAIYEGYVGMVLGGDNIRPLSWNAVGGILHQGGTIIGSSRCEDFRSRAGRLKAAKNLLENDIDALVVVGGDGSLTGAMVFHDEWSGLITDMVNKNLIPAELATRHPYLALVGLAGSIDNDLTGTDITIGADTALNRITETIDAINSTAASHKRSFVVEVMGRNCGYLALMSAIATGADWVLIPENPPNVEDWEETMCRFLHEGRQAGRRDTFVVVAEGARDRQGKPITSDHVKQVLEDILGEDTRTTILGHVQRGGAPSAFDRNLSTLLGNAAVEALMSQEVDHEPLLIGFCGNRVTQLSLRDCLAKTKEVAEAISSHDYEKAMDLRGGSFNEAFQTYRMMVRALPHPPAPGQQRLRLAIMHSGALSPGMNTAARVAVRFGLDRGHIILGIRNGFQGFTAGEVEEMGWMSVNGWASRGGADLGTNRVVPEESDFYSLARVIEQHKIDGIMIIGGWSGYDSAYRLLSERKRFPAFNIPIVCLPTTIDNNLPGTELSVGADTALNNIVSAVDKIKQSAIAHHRVFIVEVMGRYCGYLALMSGIATGAERVYLNEEGVVLKSLLDDLEDLVADFKSGKKLGLLIRNEKAHHAYTTDFMCSMFEVEGRELFDVRQAILGHLQQGGNPSPFDRILATRLATKCMQYLIEQASQQSIESAYIGLQHKEYKFHKLEDFPRMVNEEHQRPSIQWWLDILSVARTLSKYNPDSS